MNLEDNLEDHEKQFHEFLEELENRAEGIEDEEVIDLVQTQKELLELLYKAVIYAHQSDYPSHLSSEIKRSQEIIEKFQQEE